MSNENLVTSTNWVHSCRVKDKIRDFVSVKEKIVTIDKTTNKVVDVKNNIRIIEEPRRKFWVTKPEYRTHTDKKEWEYIDKLDVYDTLDRELPEKLKKILDVQDGQRFTKLKTLCNSPYVYGADIGIESLIRMHYVQNAKHDVSVVTTGGFDLEKSVIGCNRLNAMTVVLENNVYTAVLRDFLKNNVDENGNQFTATKEHIVSLIHSELQPYIEKCDFKFNLEIFDDELQMMKYIFKAINESEIDFISIWNADYDLNELINKAKEYNTSFTALNHNPKIPRKYAFSKYVFDNNPGAQHIVDKWHWMYSVGYTQYVDGMLLYARIRKGETKEPAYSLDAITSKEIGTNKLKFENSNDHYVMQTKHFAKYVVYNIADALLLQILNNQTKDFIAFGELTKISSLNTYGKPMSMLKDLYYSYYLKRGMVLGSAGDEVDDIATKHLTAMGGTVLPSYLIKDVGLRCLVGFPNIETYAYAYVFDIDYSSIYPNTKVAHNISKDSKLSTIVSINGVRNNGDIEKLFGGLATPKENAVPIGHKFFNLPNYLEMNNLFSAYMTNKLKSRL